jgi:hypothetical protein
VDVSVLYHSPFGLASSQQTARSIGRDGEHWLKWSAAQWHSWTLARFPELIPISTRGRVTHLLADDCRLYFGKFPLVVAPTSKCVQTNPLYPDLSRIDMRLKSDSGSFLGWSRTE